MLLLLPGTAKQRKRVVDDNPSAPGGSTTPVSWSVHDHPEPGPGQPPAEQRGLRLPDQRPVTEIVLRPHPRLGDTHGRCARRPAKYARLIPATARREVRSDPAYPIAVIFS